MPIDYRIDPEARIVFVDVSGKVGYPDFAAYSRGVVADPRYAAGFDELIDLRNAEGELSTGELRELVGVNLELGDRVARARLAAVTSTDLGFGLARMFEMLSEGTKVEHRVFRSMDEARSWLGLPADTVDP